MISSKKIYHQLGMCLNRKKLTNSHALAKLFLEKFSFCRKTEDWKTITAEELKEKGILPCEKHKTFTSWRKEMLKNGILICMATKSELEEDRPNFKASLFKCGDKISKYIKLAIVETIPSRIENVETRVDGVENLISTKADNERVDKLEDDVKKLENEVKSLKHNVEGLTDIVLAALPPDTPIRRRIVSENIEDRVKCVELLKKEATKSGQVN